MLLSARAESNQRRAKGAPSTNTWLTPVFIGVAPLDPHYGGTPSCQIVESSRRPEHKILHPPCPSPQGPIWSEISKCLRCADTAYSGKTVAAGPPDHRRTKQVGRHQAVCGRAAMLSNFNGKRPQWAESRKAHGQILGPPKLTDQPKGHALVNRGSGGKPPMSTGKAKCSSKASPQSLFGSFLVIQKGTRPAGRNPLYSCGFLLYFSNRFIFPR